MTVRLLTPYQLKSYVSIPAGAVVGIFDAATEAGLIAARLAEPTVAAVTWTPPDESPVYSDPLKTAAISASQFGSPTPAMLADRATVYTYAGSWYRSNGSALIDLGTGMSGAAIASLLDAFLGGPEWRTGGGGSSPGPLPVGTLVSDGNALVSDLNYLVVT